MLDTSIAKETAEESTKGFLLTAAPKTSMTVPVVQTAKDTAATPVQSSCYWVDGTFRGGVPRPRLW